jgi:hypothetical protein
VKQHGQANGQIAEESRSPERAFFHCRCTLQMLAADKKFNLAACPWPKKN